jgi:chemotaxis protein methyltransferase CheR
VSCSDQDYEYLRALVLAQSSNLIAPSRNALFETRLAPVARLAGVQDLESLVSMLQADRPARLHRAVAEAMTINETSFFRDMWPWEALRKNVIPKLIEQNAASRRLRIWSAASSTGQEAYSIAMLLQESVPELKHWDVTILGTDISEAVVEYARTAIYRRLEVNRGLPVKLLMRYLVRVGEDWQVDEKTRRMCEFRYANLCDPLRHLPAFDLILLRNVLLYFPTSDRRKVLSQAYKHLSPSGYLLLGNAEQAEDSTELFKAEFDAGCYFYRPVASDAVKAPNVATHSF